MVPREKNYLSASAWIKKQQWFYNQGEAISAGLEQQGMDLMCDGEQSLMTASWTTVVKVLSRDQEDPTEWPPDLFSCKPQEQISQEMSPDPVMNNNKVLTLPGQDFPYLFREGLNTTASMDNIHFTLSLPKTYTLVVSCRQRGATSAGTGSAVAWPGWRCKRKNVPLVNLIIGSVIKAKCQ